MNMKADQPSAAQLAGNTPQAINARVRAALLAQAVEMKQVIFSGILSAAQAAGNAPINIVPRSVGLLKKFIVEISGTANNTDGANAATISDIGLDNLLAAVTELCLRICKTTFVCKLRVGILEEFSRRSIVGV